MQEPRLFPRRGFVRETFSVYVRGLPLFVAIAVGLSGPLWLLGLARAASDALAVPVLGVLLTIAEFLIDLLLWPAIAAVLCLAASAVYLRQPFQVRAAYERLRPRWRALLLVYLAFVAAQAAAGLVYSWISAAVSGAILGAQTGRGVAALQPLYWIVGSSLLIPLQLAVTATAMVWWSLGVPALLLGEDARPGAALKRSVALVQSVWPNVVVCLMALLTITPGIVTALFMVVRMDPGVQTPSPISPTMSESGAMGNFGALAAWIRLAAAVDTVVFKPFWEVGIVVLYYELQRRVATPAAATAQPPRRRARRRPRWRPTA